MEKWTKGGNDNGKKYMAGRGRDKRKMRVCTCMIYGEFGESFLIGKEKV